MTRSLWAKIGVAFLVSLAMISLQIVIAKPRKPVADEYLYISMAQDLNTLGTFTDGRFTPKKQGSDPVPGRFFTPLYPAFLSTLSQFSTDVEEFIDCHHRKGPQKGGECPDIPKTLQLTQAVFAAIGMASVFAIALILSGSGAVAYGALLISLIAGKSAYYAGFVLSENAAFFGFYLFLAMGVGAMVYRKTSLFVLCGTAIGIATLARPSYLYLYYAMIIALLMLASFSRFQLRWKHAALFAISGLVVMAPWLIRNVLQFGELSLTSGYGGFILVQRIAYNAMTWPEWFVALIYWLPDFGDKLAAALFPPELYVRLNYSDPTSFYQVGNNALKQQTLAASGGREGHLGYLLREYVLGDLFKHFMVTFPITLRGMWIGKYIALAGVLLIWPAGRIMAKHKKLLPYLFLVLALLFMAGLHGFTSVNVRRYNVPLIGLYSFVIVLVLNDFMSRRGWLPGWARIPPVPTSI